MRKGLWFVLGVAAVSYYLLRPHGTLPFTPDGSSTGQTTVSSTSDATTGTVVQAPAPSPATPDTGLTAPGSSTGEKLSAAEPVAPSSAPPGPAVPYIPDTGDPVDSMGPARAHSSNVLNASNSPNGPVSVGSYRGGTGAAGSNVARSTMTMLSRGVSVRADRDGAMNGCREGTLLLKGPSLTFTCPAPHEDHSVTLTVDQVRGVDKNGIELVSKKKYHFHLEDMSEDQVVRLFGNWIREAKASSGGGG